MRYYLISVNFLVGEKEKEWDDLIHCNLVKTKTVIDRKVPVI